MNLFFSKLMFLNLVCVTKIDNIFMHTIKYMNKSI